MDIIFLNYNTFIKIIDTLNSRGNIIFTKTQENYMFLNLANILFIILVVQIISKLIDLIGKIIKKWQ